MSTYTVPQDVEADDKLLGPFTFRQFIYLIIVAFAIALGYFLSQIFIGLAIIPLPVVVFFGALALPLKKDQSMETYLAAVVSFYMKPKVRLWKPDGKDHIITITAPKTVEQDRTKSIAGQEALDRLTYLTNLTDSSGWSIKGSNAEDTALSDTAYNDAMNTTDILDSSSQTFANIDAQLAAADERRHQQAMTMMQNKLAGVNEPEPTPQFAPQPTFGMVIQPLSQQPAQPAPVAPQPTPIAPAAPVAQPFAQPAVQPQPVYTAPVTPIAPPAPVGPVAPLQPQTPQYGGVIDNMAINPYRDIDTTIPAAATPINPTPQQASVYAPEPAILEPASAEPVVEDPIISQEIVNLATNTDFSVETIAREAKRLEEKQNKAAADGEVYISLH